MFAIFVIRFYQLIKPVLDSLLASVFGFSSQCHYYQKGEQSCSEYTISQIKKHGTIAGLSLGGQRIAKCWKL